MKKVLFYFVCLAFISFGLVSCGDDDSSSSNGTSSNVSYVDFSTIENCMGKSNNDVKSILTSSGFTYQSSSDLMGDSVFIYVKTYGTNVTAMNLTLNSHNGSIYNAGCVMTCLNSDLAYKQFSKWVPQCNSFFSNYTCNYSATINNNDYNSYQGFLNQYNSLTMSDITMAEEDYDDVTIGSMKLSTHLAFGTISIATKDAYTNNSISLVITDENFDPYAKK